MNKLAKTTLRLMANGSMKNIFAGKRDFTRTLWHMSKSPEFSGSQSSGLLNGHKHSFNCSCGCGMKNMHTKGMFKLN